MSNFADRVKETTTTAGTGTVDLAGAATGFRTFVAGIGDGIQCYYAIVHQTLAEWEVGAGTVTDATPDTLSRTTVLASSNAGALVNFSAGTKDAFVTLPAAGVAKAALSNLDLIAINTTLVSDTDNTDDLGTSSIRWKNLYLAGFIGDANGNELLKFSQTASAVNELTITNSSAGNAPTLSATGDDTNISLTLTPQGTGDVVAATKYSITGASWRFQDVAGPAFQSTSTGESHFRLLISSGEARFKAGINFVSGNLDAVGPDTGLARNAAGVVEINNSTAGQWGAFKSGVRDSGTTTVANGLTLGHQSTGTPAAGLGSAVLFNIDSSTTADQNAAQIAALWADATHASRTADLVVYTVNSAAALAEAGRFTGAGNLTVTGAITSGGVAVPTISSTSTLTNKRITQREGTVASSATPTPNADAVDIYTVTALAAGATFGAPTGTPTQGQKLMIRIKDNGGAQTLAWNAIYRAIGVTLPTTTITSKTLYVGCVYNSTDSKWDVLATAQEA